MRRRVEAPCKGAAAGAWLSVVHAVGTAVVVIVVVVVHVVVGVQCISTATPDSVRETRTVAVTEQLFFTCR